MPVDSYKKLSPGISLRNVTNRLTVAVFRFQPEYLFKQLMIATNAKLVASVSLGNYFKQITNRHVLDV